MTTQREEIKNKLKEITIFNEDGLLTIYEYQVINLILSKQIELLEEVKKEFCQIKSCAMNKNFQDSIDSKIKELKG